MTRIASAVHREERRSSVAHAAPVADGGGRVGVGAGGRAPAAVESGRARGGRASLRGERLDLVDGVGLPAVIHLDHGVGELGLQLGGELRMKSSISV